MRTKERLMTSSSVRSWMDGGAVQELDGCHHIFPLVCLLIYGA